VVERLSGAGVLQDEGVCRSSTCVSRIERCGKGAGEDKGGNLKLCLVMGVLGVMAEEK
jgi:hypothetical protein